MSFDTLGLAEPLLRAVHEAGYTTPTPIQAQAIPAVLSGGDVMGGAQTGTGKTAGLRAADPAPPDGQAARARRRAEPCVRSAPWCSRPTRELAAQIAESVRVSRQAIPRV